MIALKGTFDSFSSHCSHREVLSGDTGWYCSTKERECSLSVCPLCKSKTTKKKGKKGSPTAKTEEALKLANSLLMECHHKDDPGIMFDLDHFFELYGELESGLE